MSIKMKRKVHLTLFIDRTHNKLNKEYAFASSSTFIIPKEKYMLILPYNLLINSCQRANNNNNIQRCLFTTIQIIIKSFSDVASCTWFKNLLLCLCVSVSHDWGGWYLLVPSSTSITDRSILSYFEWMSIYSITTTGYKRWTFCFV